MSFSSIREMLQACQESRQPLYEVILESDLAESGLTRAESEAEAREARRGTRFKEGKSDRTGVPMWEARDMSDRPTQRRRTGGRS